MEQYNNNTHVPKLLPCQHTICCSCLRELETLSLDCDIVECPKCRRRHIIPSGGFPTNRFALDIVDELSGRAQPRTFSCIKHSNIHCVLVCMDCLEGLCVECIRENCHQSHQVEELTAAQAVLREKLKEKTKIQQSVLEKQLAQMKESLFSVTEISKAEHDIQYVCDKLMTEISNWKSEELLILQSLKAEASANESKVHKKIIGLGQEKLDTESLLKRLRIAPKTDDSLHENTLVMTFDYTKQCKQLVDKVQSVLQTSSTSSQLLWQEKSINSKEPDFMYPVMNVMFVCNAVIVALLLLCFIDFIMPSEDQVWVSIHYIIFCVTYPCKVFIVWSFLFMFIILMGQQEGNFILVMSKELKQWLGATSMLSLFHLLVNFIGRILIIVLQFVLSSDGDAYINSGVIFLLIYHIIILIPWVVVSVLLEKPSSLKECFDWEKLRPGFVCYILDIITRFIVSLDWYEVLLKHS